VIAGLTEASDLRAAAKELVLAVLMDNPDKDVRFMAEVFGVPDDHPSVLRVEEALRARLQERSDALPAPPKEG
jgi:hypothetical protein